MGGVVHDLALPDFYCLLFTEISTFLFLLSFFRNRVRNDGKS